MIAECALVPDIFDSTSYNSSELCDIYLSNLKEYLLQEALVRDLYDGEWGTYIGKNTGWHPRAKELLKKLVTQKRLRLSASCASAVPANPVQWCQEALTSHKVDPLVGIITSNVVVNEFRDNALVASIEKISNTLWWQNRSPSLRLDRTTSAKPFELF